MAPAATLGRTAFVNPHLADTAWRGEHVPAPAPRPLPLGPALDTDITFAGDGRMVDLDELHRLTVTTSMVVVADGALVHDHARPGIPAGSLFLGASMSKSVLAHLVGRAVGRGALGVTETVTEHVPELAGSGYDGAPVWALLTMTSGVDWVEDHRDPDGPASRLAGCWLGRGGASRRQLATVARGAPAGTRYAYCTADSQVLDWVRERATGLTFVAALTALWEDLGCEREAVVATDDDGVAFAGGGVAAATRDWARVAMLQIDGTVTGEDGRRRLLDEEWVTASSTPERPFLRPGRLPSDLTAHAGFGRHWWALDDRGEQVTADGSRGQFAFADRRRRVVVVKTSAWPYDDRAADRTYRDLTYLALPAVAEAAAGHRPSLPGTRPGRPLEGDIP